MTKAGINIDDRKTIAIRRFAKKRVQCFYESLVQVQVFNGTFVLPNPSLAKPKNVIPHPKIPQ
jgi:hypothetical protein